MGWFNHQLAMIWLQLFWDSFGDFVWGVRSGVGQCLKNWEITSLQRCRLTPVLLCVGTNMVLLIEEIQDKPDDMVDIQWYPIFLHYICTAGFYDTPQLVRRISSISHTPKSELFCCDEGFYAFVPWCATWGTNVWNSHLMFILTSCNGIGWRKTCLTETKQSYNNHFDLKNFTSNQFAATLN